MPEVNFRTNEKMIDSPTVYVFMSGYGSDSKEQYQFEWEKLTADMNVSRIYVLNRTGKWYHDCFNELKEYLEPLIAGKEVVFIGASMGGYAALIMAHLFNAKSITIGPQSSLHADFKEKYDKRWEDKLGEVRKETLYKDYLDISFIKGKQHHVFYAVDCPEDKIQAERLEVCLHPLPYNSHNTALWMKRQGILKEALSVNCQ